MRRNHHLRRSSVLEAHQIYLQYHREATPASDAAATSNILHEDDDRDNEDTTKHPTVLLNTTEDREHKPVPQFPMFHRVQKTGVIYATSRASCRGFSPESAGEWA